MKKIIASVMVCVLLLTTCTSTLGASFSDLGNSRWDWARDTIIELADKGIIKGYSDGTYQPLNDITNQEAFTLFARIIGVNDPVNAAAVEAAQSLYASVAEKYNTYATKELCFMLYRGIFTENELDTYLGESTKNLPMKRHEAAILITSIMGGKSEVENTVIYVFDYTDADQIPAASKGYIDFVTKKGIMQGMEDNTFSPNTNVTRAQIAIMLKKTMAAMNMTTVGGTITSIDKNNKTFVIDGETHAVNAQTRINLDGQPVNFDELSIGNELIVTLAYNSVWAVDGIKGNAQNTQIIDAIFNGSVTDTRGKFITAYERHLGISAAKEYQVGDDVSYTYNGGIATLSQLAQGDRVFITITDDVVTAVDAESKITTIDNARVAEIVLNPVPSLKITHASSAYDQKVYEIYDSVAVTKNKKLSALRNLLQGDIVSLTLEYGTIISIDAMSQLSTTEGTIEEITIGNNNSSIKIHADDITTSYAIVRDTQILVDGRASTIYDLRLGYMVTINIESNVVTSIDVHSVTQSKTITGTISIVNDSLGFINLSVVDAYGNITTQQVFVDSGVSIIGSATAMRKTLEDLVVGDQLMITGDINMGVFEAGTIILLEK